MYHTNKIIKHFVKLFSAQFGTTGEGSKSSNPQNSPAADVGSKYKELVVTLENGVLTIRINRPAKYNAITWEVHVKMLTMNFWSF